MPGQASPALTAAAPRVESEARFPILPLAAEVWNVELPTADWLSYDRVGWLLSSARMEGYEEWSVGQLLVRLQKVYRDEYERVDSLRQRLSTAENDRDEAQYRVNELHEEVTTLKASTPTSAMEVGQLQCYVERLRRERNSVRADVAHYKQRIEALQQQVSALRHPSASKRPRSPSMYASFDGSRMTTPRGRQRTGTPRSVAGPNRAQPYGNRASTPDPYARTAPGTPGERRY